MEQYRHNPHYKRTVEPLSQQHSDPLLESAVQRVNQLSSILEAQQRQIRRLESQLVELQRLVLSNRG